MTTANKTQTLRAAFANLKSVGFRFSVNVEATSASRGYAYFTVTVKATRGDISASASYKSSTVNANHIKGSDFRGRVEHGVCSSVQELLHSGYLNANSNAGRAIAEIAAQLEPVLEAA